MPHKPCPSSINLLPLLLLVQLLTNQLLQRPVKIKTVLQVTAPQDSKNLCIFKGVGSVSLRTSYCFGHFSKFSYSALGKGSSLRQLQMTESPGRCYVQIGGALCQLVFRQLHLATIEDSRIS